MSVEDQKVLELEQRKEKIYFGGGTKAIEKQKAMGKMTARERIIALLDEGSFHEYDMFVEHDGRDFGMQDKSLPGRRRHHRHGHDLRSAHRYLRTGLYRGRRLARLHARP